jgi:hypothetical protein
MSFGNRLGNTPMQYELDCACGNKILVRETAAGAKELCPCGRTLVVPSLHELRQRAGLPVPGLSPEKVVETLLLAGKLPQEDACVLCGITTEGVLCCTTECERAYVQSSQPPWWWLVLSVFLNLLPFGWIGDVIVSPGSGEESEWGTDRVFPLPLRVCADCQHLLTDPCLMKEALNRVPLYRQLLEKYPEAKITMSSR